MNVSVTANAALVILQARYDFHSARAVLSTAANAAGIDAKGPFDAKALAALADAVRGADDSAAAVAEALRGAGGTPAAKKPAPAAERPAAEKPAAEKPAAGKAPAKGKAKPAKPKAKAAKPKAD